MTEKGFPDNDADRNATLHEGEPMETRLDIPCHVCGEKNVLNISVTLRLPHFGNALQMTHLCTSCGFRHSDVIMLENRGPMRCELFVNTAELLNSRVLRSNSGTIRVPEIGAVIEPAAASDSFVSNVEGVLDRIVEVVKLVSSDSELDVYERCSALLGKIDRMREGREKFHLVIDDPYGNSAILGDGVSVRKLSEKETSVLETGEMTLDSGHISAIRTGDEGAGHRSGG